MVASRPLSARRKSDAGLLERLLNPAIVWVLVPVLGIFVWGIVSVVETLRGAPEGLEEWKLELQQLRARVEALERAQQTTDPVEPVRRSPAARGAAGPAAEFSVTNLAGGVRPLT